MNSFRGGRLAAGLHRRPAGLAIDGVKSTLRSGLTLGLKGAYGEFLRLTIRGRCTWRVCTHLSFALASSSALHQRWWRLGCSGGKSPGSGLFAFDQVQVCRKGQVLGSLATGCCALVKQPAHCVVR